MADLVTTAEAAALWGCSERNIQLYAREGKIPVAQAVRSAVNGQVLMLFRPADILAARATRKRNRAITAKRNGVTGAEKLRQHRAKLLRVWYTLPKSERTGRNWMAKAHRIWTAQQSLSHPTYGA